MLSDADKVAIRRHLNYSVKGDPTVANYGHAYFTMYGQLEYRMNHLAVEEERIITGANPPVDPRYIDEDSNVYYGYIAILNYLDSSVAKYDQNLDIKKAGDYEPNPNEMDARTRLYNRFRMGMSRFLGITPYTTITSGLWVA